jgi:hypothetical protein
MKRIAAWVAAWCLCAGAALGQRMVDGAVNPEMIPDAAAYELLFRVLNPARNEHPLIYRDRVKTYLSNLVQLNELEGFILHEAARRYDYHLGELAKKVTSASALEEMRKERDAMVLRLAEEVKGRLGEDGKAKLARHLEHVKRNTKRMVKE